MTMRMVRSNLYNVLGGGAMVRRFFVVCELFFQSKRERNYGV